MRSEATNPENNLMAHASLENVTLVLPTSMYLRWSIVHYVELEDPVNWGRGQIPIRTKSGQMRRVRLILSGQKRVSCGRRPEEVSGRAWPDPSPDIEPHRTRTPHDITSLMGHV